MLTDFSIFVTPFLLVKKEVAGYRKFELLDENKYIPFSYKMDYQKDKVVGLANFGFLSGLNVNLFL